MESPLNASSSTAGSLLSGGRFHVPEFQREYAWGRDEVDEFFSDLAKSLHDETYFLGLVILTGEGTLKEVVDGQQRLLTTTLLAAALYHEALAYERKALADRIQSTFLRAIDFASDEEQPRLALSGAADNATLEQILLNPASSLANLKAADDESVSALLLDAYRRLSTLLTENLADDPFKRLGLWADFLSNKLYLANFVHPDPSSAYRVFEVVNTRGKELTTADLLKNFVLSQTAEKDRPFRYQQWQEIAGAFGTENAASFVQFIRHAVTTQRGHVEPRDLYDVLSSGVGSRGGMTPAELMGLLAEHLPRYRQMMDPTMDGPSSEEELAAYSVLNRLGVISVRPIALAMAGTANGSVGLADLLRLVVRRMVVGNLGTGNVERRFGQAAQRISTDRTWEAALAALEDLIPAKDDFLNQLHKRSLNRGVLAVARQSVVQGTITPRPDGYLYVIKPRDTEWSPEDEDRAAYWVSTIGNTLLADQARRPMGSSTWAGFKTSLLPHAVSGEWVNELSVFTDWNIETISEIGRRIAEVAADVWYAQ